LVRNPVPTNTAISSNHRVLADSMARTVQYTASVSNSTNKASGLLNRNISTATGVRASTAPASSPAAGVNHRRTVRYTTPTDATPSRAWGTRMLQALTPKIRADTSITHSDAGGLSTVMKLDESEEPKKAARRLLVPAWTAAE